MGANANLQFLMFSPQISSHRPNIYACLMKIMLGDNIEDHFVLFGLIRRAVILWNEAITPRAH